MAGWIFYSRSICPCLLRIFSWVAHLSLIDLWPFLIRSGCQAFGQFYTLQLSSLGLLCVFPLFYGVNFSWYTEVLNCSVVEFIRFSFMDSMFFYFVLKNNWYSEVVKIFSLEFCFPFNSFIHVGVIPIWSMD